MKRLYSSLSVFMLGSLALQAQTYCEPTFANGCFNWQTLSATIGGINYTSGPDCTVGDYTSLSTLANAGDTLPVFVQNGVWCGVSLWVDLNQDMVFDTTENLYHQYTGGAPDYSYNFDVIIPMGTPNGSYRLRLISPWGSDGYSSTNMNGFGPCGAYQYGNYQDFTLNVGLGTSVRENTITGIKVYPNPVQEQLTIVGPIDRVPGYLIMNSSGQEVQRWTTSNIGKQVIDITGLPAGVYSLITMDGAHRTLFAVQR